MRVYLSNLGCKLNQAELEELGYVLAAAEEVDGLLADSYLDGLDAILVPGGFGIRGVEGKIRSIRYARDHDVPFLGLCLGLFCAALLMLWRFWRGLSAHTQPTAST